VSVAHVITGLNVFSGQLATTGHGLKLQCAQGCLSKGGKFVFCQAPANMIKAEHKALPKSAFYMAFRRNRQASTDEISSAEHDSRTFAPLFVTVALNFVLSGI